MANIIKIRIFADANQENPTLELPDVPWYAGVTALQAMILGEALHPANFAFRVVYRSIYGAFVDCIDGLSDGDKPDHFWLLYVNGDESEVGASEAIILEDTEIRVAIVEWRYIDTTTGSHRQAASKTKAL